MSIARKKYDEYLQWLRELAAKENWPFSDVLRVVIKDPKGKLRLSDLINSEDAENRLIELGRVEYYERIFDDLMKVTSLDIDGAAENRMKKMRQANMDNVRILGTKKRKEQGAETRRQILEMNSDLLKKPRSEGWKKEARANHIAGKVGRSESYVSKLIATSRKTKQT